MRALQTENHRGDNQAQHTGRNNGEAVILPLTPLVASPACSVDCELGSERGRRHKIA